MLTRARKQEPYVIASAARQMEAKRIYPVVQLYLIALLCFTGCQARKNLNISKTSSMNTEELKVNTRTENRELMRGSRIIQISDSTDHSYQVTIFPLDTFSFSPEKGFHGQALRVEIKGRQTKETLIADSASRYSYYGKIEKANIESAQLQKQKTESKSKEKSGVKVAGILTGLVLVLWLIWAVRKD